MRKLPSLSSLRAFEAAARHQSFKSAANELGLSPTAISHQVRSLERFLDRPLFLRQVRRVELNQAGRDLAGVLTPALDEVASAVARLRDSGEREIVTLGAGPIFASRWLVPRLGVFWRDHPDVDLRIHHSPLPLHQQPVQYDIAVAWGRIRSDNMTVEPLLSIAVTPVLAPDANFTTGVPSRPQQLLDLPLLHQRSHDGWRHWLEQAGVDLTGRRLPGSIIDDTNVLLQAVLDGQGVGLGILPFIAEDLAAGRLIQPWPLTVDPGESYCLIYPRLALRRRSVQAVRNWLRRELVEPSVGAATSPALPPIEISAESSK